MEQFEVGGNYFVTVVCLSFQDSGHLEIGIVTQEHSVHFDDRDPPCKNVIGAYCSIVLHLGIIVTFPLCNTASHKYAH